MFLEAYISPIEIISTGLGFAFCGGSIKYIDDAFDYDSPRKTIAILLAPIVGIVSAVLVCQHSEAATIFLSITVGVGLKGKIDTAGHWAALGVCLIFLALYPPDILLFPLIVLSCASLADEIGSDYHKSLLKTPSTKEPGSLERLFHLCLEYRSFMKLAMVLLTAINLLSWQYLLSFLLFDMAYHLVGFCTYDTDSPQPQPLNI